MITLRKYTHPTVVVEKDGRSLVIDPGTFTPHASALVAQASAALITHEHPDHADVSILSAALANQPGLQVWGPETVARHLPGHGDRVRVVESGDSGRLAGFDVAVVGGVHEAIHPDMSPSGNLGYVIDSNVYHPGDSYFVPGLPVKTLLVPMSGPFARIDKIVDFIRAVAPERAIQIHDLLLTPMGKTFLASFIDPLTSVPLTILDEGESVRV